LSNNSGRWRVQALALQADVAQVDQVERLVAETVEKLGPINILVNNAGITRDTLLLRMKLEDSAGRH
jgi:3-oxoacyl-[acyl-carrier protein] reductase